LGMQVKMGGKIHLLGTGCQRGLERFGGYCATIQDLLGRFELEKRAR